MTNYYNLFLHSGCRTGYRTSSRTRYFRAIVPAVYLRMRNMFNQIGTYEKEAAMKRVPLRVEKANKALVFTFLVYLVVDSISAKVGPPKEFIRGRLIKFYFVKFNYQVFFTSTLKQGCKAGIKVILSEDG